MKIDKESGIFLHKNEKEGKKGKIDLPLAEAINEMFDRDFLVDLGCSTGKYCKFFDEKGWIVQGYEGNPYISDFKVFPYVQIMDLSVPQKTLPVDLVICLEVGEHVPYPRMKVFLDNVIGFTGEWLVLSWAVPGQGGTGHVNEMSNMDIINEVEKRGLKFDSEKSKKLRAAASFRWFKNTVMVFNYA